MAKKFKIEEKDFDGLYFGFGSINWTAHIEGNTLIFEHDEHKGDPAWIKKLEDVKVGDYVGLEAKGRDSKAFKMEAPRNPRNRILWENGFLRGHKFVKDDDASLYWHIKESIDIYIGGELYRRGSRSILFITIKDKNGKSVLETANGRIAGTDNTVRNWWMSTDCPLAAVKEWEKRYKAAFTDQTQPLPFGEENIFRYE